jgi:hypothetical protein
MAKSTCASFYLQLLSISSRLVACEAVHDASVFRTLQSVEEWGERASSAPSLSRPFSLQTCYGLFTYQSLSVTRLRSASTRPRSPPSSRTVSFIRPSQHHPSSFNVLIHQAASSIELPRPLRCLIHRAPLALFIRQPHLSSSTNSTKQLLAAAIIGPALAPVKHRLTHNISCLITSSLCQATSASLLIQQRCLSSITGLISCQATPTFPLATCTMASASSRPQSDLQCQL